MDRGRPASLPKNQTGAVIERLQRAWNAHDIEAFVACFDPGYDSRWPIHPERDFRGVDHVRERWAGNFERMPDFRADLLALAAGTDGTAWTEWRWSGTRADGTRMDDQGVIVYSIRDGRIAAGRLYLEPRPAL